MAAYGVTTLSGFSQSSASEPRSYSKRRDVHCCYFFNTRILNTAAALFHGIQSIVVFSLIAWLNSKPIKQTFISSETQKDTYNASTMQGVWYPNVTNMTRIQLDFMNQRPGVFPLFRTIGVWHKVDDGQKHDPMQYSKIRAMSSDFFIENRDMSSGEIDVRYIAASFFGLSCIFQIFGGYLYSGKIGSRLRFIEYSFSASIMIMAIAVESGIRNTYTIIMMFVLTWVTQILGLLAETMSEISEKAEVHQDEPILGTFGVWSWLAPHIAGWATCIAAYAPIIDNFHESNKASETKAPGFVNVIVYLQFTLFSCFGIVQLYSLVRRTNIIQSYTGSSDSSMSLMRSAAYGSDDSNMSTREALLANVADTTERIYIVLSFTAKTLLAWLILSPIITDAVD